MTSSPTTRRLTATAMTLLLAIGVAGCSGFGLFGNDVENEVEVTVEAISAEALQADDGFTYQITADTEYEGFDGWTDITVGTVVEIEYDIGPDDTTRVALEIEADD